MINKQSNKDLIKEISKLTCGSSLVCQAATESRLNNYLTDQTFELALSYLDKGRLIAIKFLNGKAGGSNTSDLNFNWLDLIDGTSENFVVKGVSNELISGQNGFMYNEILKKVNLISIGTSNFNGVNYIIGNYPAGDLYHITFKSDTKSEDKAPGSVVVTPVNKAPETSTNGSGLIPATVSKFDYSTLIIPGLVVLGFVLLSNKNFKI